MNPEQLEPRGGVTGLAVLVLIAMLGGAARQAHQLLTGKKLSWKHFVIRAVISAFIGVIAYYALPMESPYRGAMCGLFGWLGADGISLLLRLVTRRDDDEKIK